MDSSNVVQSIRTVNGFFLLYPFVNPQGLGVVFKSLFWFFQLLIDDAYVVDGHCAVQGVLSICSFINGECSIV